MPRVPHRLALPFALVLALFASLAPAFTGCAGTGVNAGDFNLISLDEEWELGRQIEADVNQQVRLVDDATLQRYVDQLGQQIVSRTELSGQPWRFRVIADDEINAFNIPGGVVYVNTGLIEAAGSASELVGVMAHEVSHGVARHGTERLTTQYGISIVAGLVLGQNPGLVEQIAAQVVAGGAIARYSRGAENEADELGVRYMAASGWDPEGLARMLERLIERYGSGGGIPFFSSHPTTESRVQNVRALAQGVSRGGLRESDGQFASVRSRAARY